MNGYLFTVPFSVSISNSNGDFNKLAIILGIEVVACKYYSKEPKLVIEIDEFVA